MESIQAGIELTRETNVRKHSSQGGNYKPRVCLQGKQLTLPNFEAGETIIFIMDEGEIKIRGESDIRPTRWEELIGQQNTKVAEIGPYKGYGRVTITGQTLKDTYKFEIGDTLLLKLRDREIDVINQTYKKQQ